MPWHVVANQEYVALIVTWVEIYQERSSYWSLSQEMYAYRGLSTLPDNPGDSRFWTIPAPTLFDVFSPTLPCGARERECVTNSHLMMLALLLKRVEGKNKFANFPSLD